MNKTKINHAEILMLKRWNTPSIYNGWEQITRRDFSRECFNIEETVDFLPMMGSMVGYAVTLIIEPSNHIHKTGNPGAVSQYRKYIASVPGPKIVVVQDLDKPEVYGSYWGEVNSNVHKALGCVGTITDGAIRDLDEMNNEGFKALARRLCVGHAYVAPVHWGCEVEVFGCQITPGQLIHADKHGFLAIPTGEESNLLEAVQYMDANECKTVIQTARNAIGKSMKEILISLDEASNEFQKMTRDKFGRRGEW